MQALDVKLLRDLARLWRPVLAIALVLGCGVMTLVSMRGTALSLEAAQARHYAEQRFADVFAEARRIPPHVVQAIAALPGVGTAEGRLVARGRFAAGAATGSVHLVSLPDRGLPGLNRPRLEQGLWPGAEGGAEVVLSDPFARALGLRPGADLALTVGGRAARWRVTGTALSPEFVYAVPAGSMMPDDARHGIVWMPQARLAALTGLQGQWNSVAVRLAPGASEAAVIAGIDSLLAPWGGTGATGRGRQVSHAFLDNELTQLGVLARWLPPVFLAVAAFLVNMVLDRLIRLERAQIGLLRAAGYGAGRILRHYLALALAIAIPGLALGLGAGWLAGQAMTALYAGYFRLPDLGFALDAAGLVLAGGAAAASVLLGAARAVRRAARLAPAEAMQPPAPPAFGRGLADPLGRVLGLSGGGMMVLRGILRRPGRAVATVAGLAAAVAILVASFFTFDVIEAVMADLFGQANRQDVTLTLPEGTAAHPALLAARALPGVLAAEPETLLPVRLRAGHRERLLILRAHRPDNRLTRALGSDGGAARIPAAGLALPVRLAEALALSPGDPVEVELLTPPRTRHVLPFAATTRQAMGQEALVPAPVLARLLRRDLPAAAIGLRLDPARRPAFDAVLARSPVAEGMQDWRRIEARFRASVNESLLVTALVFSAIGVLMTMGITYNAARIQLAERHHELATLEVLGYARARTTALLVAEQMVLALAALPPGMLAGYGLAAGMSRAFSSDLASLPLVVSRGTHLTAGLLVLGTALIASLLVARGLGRASVATALKRRE